MMKGLSWLIYLKVYKNQEDAIVQRFRLYRSITLAGDTGAVRDQWSVSPASLLAPPAPSNRTNTARPPGAELSHLV